MKERLLTLMLILALVGSFVLAPTQAAAQSTGSKLLKNIPVTGTLQGGGTFDGKLSITRLDVGPNGSVLASGLLKGVATKADGTRQNINTTFSRFPLNLAASGQGGACDILTLDLGPLHLDLLGLVIDLSPVQLDVTAVPGPGNLLGNLLCALAGLLDGGPLTAINFLLGQINALLGSGGVLAGIPVVGGLADGGTFAGTLAITQLAPNPEGGLLVSGVLRGVATLADGTTKNVNTTFTNLAGVLTANAACDILTLDLGPLHLDLLGLVIDLSAVHLDVTAVPGAGNLLGNLLCAVAGLLDGGPGGALGNLLNIINRLLG